MLLALEYPRRAGVGERTEPRGLEKRARRAEVAGEHGDAPVVAARVGGAADHALIGGGESGKLVADRATRDGECLAVQEAGFEQRLHHDPRSAGVVQVAREELSTRLQIGEQRRAREDRRDILEGERHPRFMRDGGEVQGRVGRAARGAHHRAGVLERESRHDFARCGPIIHYRPHQHRRRSAEHGGPLAVDGGDHARADR